MLLFLRKGNIVDRYIDKCYRKKFFIRRFLEFFVYGQFFIEVEIKMEEYIYREGSSVREYF